MFPSACFRDRADAGRLLARALREQLPPSDLHDALVLALPRGGVPVAYELARDLHLPLDVFVVRKIGVPGQPELAMGAIASGGVIVTQPDVLRAYRIAQDTLHALAARERLEIERREALYRAGRPPLTLAGRTVILVDDGLATGSTMMAAVRALRAHAHRILVAVPVAAPVICEEIAHTADRVVCLHTPERFHAVGEFYRHFDQTTDEEVRALLQSPPSP